MTEQQVFKVTAIEYFETEEGKTPKTPIVHIWEKHRIGTDAESLIFAVQYKLAKAVNKTPAAAAAFFNRLKVSADLVNFPN